MTGSLPPAASGPAVASRRILRHELLHLLDHSRHFALTLLLAPAGSGKSTLLQQWRQHHDGTCVLLSLQAADQDPVLFFRHLSAGLRQAIPGFDSAAYNRLSAEIAVPAHSVAETLAQALAHIAAPLTLVLDDFQHAHHPFTQAVMAQLLEQLPEQLHLVLASRCHPDFSLSRLKLDDKLLLIDGHDLRLQAQQVHELAAELQLQLSDEAVSHLLAMTEGWMAGVKIALLARARSGPAALQGFNGRQPDLVDYFAHVVLRDLPDDMHDFLLCSAALAEFDAGLCDHVLTRSDSALLIERIQAHALFLQEHSDKPGHFRYHPLFRDFLETRLAMEMPSRINSLHAAACDYLLAQGATAQALAHARQSHAEKFQTVLASCCARWLQQGDYPAIIAALDALDDEQLIPQDELVLPLISALIFSRRFNQARYYLDASLAARPDTDGPDSLRAFLGLLLHTLQHETIALSAADQALLQTLGQHHDIRAFSLALLAYHHMQRANFMAARQYAQHAKTVLGQLGLDYLESHADLILILCDRHSGHPLPSMQRAQAMLERFHKSPQSPAWINAALATAVVRYEQNQLQAAQDLCEELMPRVSTACATEVIVITYLSLSRLLFLRGESARANRLLQQLHRILELGSYQRFRGQLVLEAVLQTLHAGPALQQLAQEQQLLTWLQHHAGKTPAHYSENWERYGLATALFLRQQGRLAEATDLLLMLSQATRHFGVLARALIIDANRVVLLQQQGQWPQAMTLLQQLISEHGLTGLNRIVFDEAPGLAAVLQQAVQQQHLHLPDIYLQVFQDVLVSTALPQPASTMVANLSALTGRELEIFRLLQQGLSNTEISQATGTALSTIKWHLKNIFAKLGVSSRTAAILQGRRHPA